MALIECYECAREISDAAPVCIHCGAPAKQAREATKNDLQARASTESSQAPSSTTGKSFWILAETYLYKLVGYFLGLSLKLFEFYLSCWRKSPIWTLVLSLFIIAWFVGYAGKRTSYETTHPTSASQISATPAPTPAPAPAPAPAHDGAKQPLTSTAAVKNSSKNEPASREAFYASKIPDYVLTPYSAGTFKKFSSRRSEIETLRRLSAERAIDSGKCDEVEVSELSQVKSTLHDLHFFVDCKNTQRITFSEIELKENSTAKTAEERSWSCTKAIMACADSIRSNVDIPSRLDLHTLIGSSCYKAPLTFNVQVKYDFGYKNDYGVQDEFTATCNFKPGESSGTIETSPKR